MGGARTVAGGVLACVNAGVPPPDAARAEDGAHVHFWTGTRGKANDDGLRTRIAAAAVAALEFWQPRGRFRALVDATPEDARRMVSGLRRAARDERVLLLYAGHGVPRPTAAGELWLFNRGHTQYVPVAAGELLSWAAGGPAVLVLDASGARAVLDAPSSFGRIAHPVAVFGSCGGSEAAPCVPFFPADAYTAALLSPLEMAVRHALRRPGALGVCLRFSGDDAAHVSASFLSGRPGERRTPLGEAHWVLTAVADAAAWAALPSSYFAALFRADVLLASLARNHVLALRVLGALGARPFVALVEPGRVPAVLDAHFAAAARHALWGHWDRALGAALRTGRGCAASFFGAHLDLLSMETRHAAALRGAAYCGCVACVGSSDCPGCVLCGAVGDVLADRPKKRSSGDGRAADASRMAQPSKGQGDSGMRQSAAGPIAKHSSGDETADASRTANPYKGGQNRGTRESTADPSELRLSRDGTADASRTASPHTGTNDTHKSPADSLRSDASGDGTANIDSIASPHRGNQNKGTCKSPADPSELRPSGDGCTADDDRFASPHRGNQNNVTDMSTADPTVNHPYADGREGNTPAGGPFTASSTSQVKFSHHGEPQRTVALPIALQALLSQSQRCAALDALAAYAAVSPGHAQLVADAGVLPYAGRLLVPGAERGLLRLWAAVLLGCASPPAEVLRDEASGALVAGISAGPADAGCAARTSAMCALLLAARTTAQTWPRAGAHARDVCVRLAAADDDARWRDVPLLWAFAAARSHGASLPPGTYIQIRLSASRVLETVGLDSPPLRPESDRQWPESGTHTWREAAISAALWAAAELPHVCRDVSAARSLAAVLSLAADASPAVRLAALAAVARLCTAPGPRSRAFHHGITAALVAHVCARGGPESVVAEGAGDMVRNASAYTLALRALAALAGDPDAGVAAAAQAVLGALVAGRDVPRPATCPDRMWRSAVLNAARAFFAPESESRIDGWARGRREDVEADCAAQLWDARAAAFVSRWADRQDMAHLFFGHGSAGLDSALPSRARVIGWSDTHGRLVSDFEFSPRLGRTLFTVSLPRALVSAHARGAFAVHVAGRGAWSGVVPGEVVGACALDDTRVLFVLSSRQSVALDTRLRALGRPADLPVAPACAALCSGRLILGSAAGDIVDAQSGTKLAHVPQLRRLHGHERGLLAVTSNLVCHIEPQHTADDPCGPEWKVASAVHVGHVAACAFHPRQCLAAVLHAGGRALSLVRPPAAAPLVRRAPDGRWADARDLPLAELLRADTGGAGDPTSFPFAFHPRRLALAALLDTPAVFAPRSLHVVRDSLCTDGLT